MKRTILYGLLAGLVMLIVNMVFGQLFNLVFPSVAKEYINPGLFRPWQDPLMSLYFLGPFITGIIMAFFWSKLKNLIAETSTCKKGLTFGLMYWLVSIPGMIISYSSFPVSFPLVLSWTLGGLLSSIFAGLIFAKLMK